MSLIIRELLLGPYIILNGFLAWWRIHFGRVLTPAFIPSFLLDEGHSLYLQNDFSLFSFIPAFLPSSTPGHESENLTPHRRGEGGESERDGRQTEEENKRRWRQLEGRETSWSISRRNKEPETIWSGPRFLEVQDAALNMANQSVHRWCRSPHHNSQLCNVLYSFAQFVCRIILLAASLRLSWLTQWCIIWHKTLPRALSWNYGLHKLQNKLSTNPKIVRSLLNISRARQLKGG